MVVKKSNGWRGRMRTTFWVVHIIILFYGVFNLSAATQKKVIKGGDPAHPLSSLSTSHDTKSPVLMLPSRLDKEAYDAVFPGLPGDSCLYPKTSKRPSRNLRLSIVAAPGLAAALPPVQAYPPTLTPPPAELVQSVPALPPVSQVAPEESVAAFLPQAGERTLQPPPTSLADTSSGFRVGSAQSQRNLISPVRGLEQQARRLSGLVLSIEEKRPDSDIPRSDGPSLGLIDDGAAVSSLGFAQDRHQLSLAHNRSLSLADEKVVEGVSIGF
jgi:hypothetical protein